MFTEFFDSAFRIRELRNCPDSPLIEGFARELCQAGHAEMRVRRHIRAAEHLIYWTSQEGRPISTLDEQFVEEFAHHLNRLLSDACLDPKELAALLGRTEVLVYKYLQGVHLPKLHDLPELAQALNLKSCRDLIPQEWCNPER